MMKKTLTYIGRDDWSRPLYRDENGRIWVDVDPRSDYAPHICTITDAGAVSYTHLTLPTICSV